MTPDLNVLLAAWRPDHVHHLTAHRWLVEALADRDDGERLALLPMVTVGFLRLATNRRVFPNPAPPAAAVAFIDSLHANRGVEVISVGDEWPLVRQLCLDHELSGNDLTDAWIAASVLANGDHLVTFDRGFSRWLSDEQVTILAAAPTQQ